MAEKETIDVCWEHSGHSTILANHERRLETCQGDHVMLWDAIKKKVSNAFFILLCGFVIGGLGVQLKIYDTIKNVEKKVAVIEALVNSEKEKNSGKP